MNRFRLFVAVLCAALAGCATVDQKAAAPSDDKDYVTGSRIPLRSGESSSTMKTSDKQSIDTMMNPAYVPSRPSN